VTAERWKQIEAMFEQALELSPEQRQTFLHNSCNGDEELRREVESLLASHDQASTFIERPNFFLPDDCLQSESSALEPGQLIGPYRLVRELGRGGMGAVYLAERADEQYQKRVAIKVIKRGMDTDTVLRHFRKERQILATFDHPNIARLFDAGTTADGLPYFVMEYVDGIPLDQYCEAHRVAIPERLKLFREVCAAVSYAHRHTVIHRDIKPSNILVTNEGVPKLLDFGIAKMLSPSDGAETLATATGLRPMTPYYASPEQIRAEPVTTATDVFSLGVVLYELLTGSSPYRLTNRSQHEIERAITEQEPTKPSTVIRESRIVNRASKIASPAGTDSRFTKTASPARTDPRVLRGDLDNIVLMALRKEPQRRYQSVEQFAEDIGRHLESRPILARPARPPVRIWRWSQRNPVLAGAIVICMLLTAAVAWLLPRHIEISAGSPPEKTVAVLPFQNLSKDQENAFFTDGVQDEILTSLSRVADLKVISRTSVMQYKDLTKRNLREIGQQLGVANVVEGSVQRAGNRVRVNAQLIDARNDAHLWAQSYDGDLTDVFGIQSQIAQIIANQLQAKISAREKTAIERLPTTNIAAYELYRRALPLEFRPPFREHLFEAIRLLEQAVARDPKFLPAYCALSRFHMVTYFGGIDHTPARRELARLAIEKAAQIQPDAAEVHLEEARYWFHGFFDYDRARTELELARRGLPNNSQVCYLTAAMDRRQGRWSEAIQNFQRAVELDPRDGDSLMNTAFTLEGLRRYSEATEYYRRAAALDSHDYFARIAARGFQAMNERADLRPLRAELNAILAEDPKALPQIAEHLWPCAIMQRDRAAIDQALAAIPPEGIYVGGNFVRPREDFVAYAARMFGDEATATRAYTAARAIFQKQVEEQPKYATAWSYLGWVDSALGRKEEAIREGRRACELLPLSKDAWFGPGQLRSLAKIYACTGEKDLALATLEQLLNNRVSGIDYGRLKLDPDWDPLRGDPRFEKFVASLAPRSTSTVQKASIPENGIAVVR